jgi:hypothetical protein
MKTSDLKPDWALTDLSEEGQEDLRRLKQFGGGAFDVDAGHAAFEARIAKTPPAKRSSPRGLLVGALVLSGLVLATGFATLHTQTSTAPPAAPTSATDSTPAAPVVNAELTAAPASVPTSSLPTTTIPSVNVEALPTVVSMPVRSVPAPAVPPVATAGSGTTSTALQAPAVDLVEAEVRHASRLRIVARTDPREALSLAAEGDRLFPNGLLHAEREAIAIEALARLERTGEARTRAEAFTNAYPSHPRAGRIRAISKGERPWER